MCGIGGEFVFRGDGRVASDRIAPMLGLLAHRGPDDWGYYVDSPARLMLVHARLALVDLEHGRQPLANEDGTCWLSVNGEIYGYEQIGRELRERGHVLATRTDSEVILHLYEDFGDEFPQHLRGEFAIALYDERRRTLYLVRDRFGIKPLYYTVRDGSIIFASEIKALLAHPLVSATLDEGTLQSMIATIIPPGDTLFSGIKQVEPGCFLKISGGEVRSHAYWRLPLAEGAAANDGQVRDEQRAVEEFRDLLTEAVRLRLHGDVAVGTYLSGGIDSAAIAALMAHVSDRPVPAFTIGFENAAYDESPFASAVAAHAGLEHHLLRVGPDGLAAAFQHSLWHTELPVMNAHGAAKFLLSRLARGRVKAVLTGEGADEILLGYAQFRHQQLLEQQARDPSNRAAAREMRHFLAYEGVQFGVTTARRYEQGDRVRQLFGTYPYPLLRALRFRGVRRLVVSGEFTDRTRERDPVVELARHLNRSELDGLPSLMGTQHVLIKTDLAGYILNVLGDRAEMAHSIEGRLPFLDHKLVEFACRLPMSLKLRDGRNKYILRRAVADLLPDELRNRQKKQFMSPSPEVLGLGRDSAPFDEYLAPRVVREVGVFRPAALAGMRKLLGLLPRDSYLYGVCEGTLVFALSLHIIHEMFCRSFAAYTHRFASPLANGDVPHPARTGHRCLARRNDPSPVPEPQ